MYLMPLYYVGFLKLFMKNTINIIYAWINIEMGPTDSVDCSKQLIYLRGVSNR